jgi:AmiR/NasT family two-component response regulator
MSSSSLRILIVDDDPQLRFCLRAQLTNLGHQVIAEAADGEEAVRLARQQRPDLVVMDIRMPNVDGLEASQTIGQEAPCPIILLSAYSNPELVKEAGLLPVQAYLVKPVQERELDPAIELAMARFQENQQLRGEMTRIRHIIDTRLAIKQATTYLIEHQNCTPHEALERIQQEARAKRVALDKVAKAIVCETPIFYQHDAPI